MTSISKNASSDAVDANQGNELMAQWSIAHDGRHYHYDGYRYEHLVDALTYAQLIRARQLPRTHPSAVAQIEAIPSPNESDRRLMLELSISYEKGSYVFAGFRYDRLIDAANYAYHCRRLSAATLK